MQSLHKQLANLFIIPTIACALSSCEKELDFEYHDIDPILVIEGALTQDNATVSLTLTTPMDEPMNTTRLTDAVVKITDLTANSEVLLSPDGNGCYMADMEGLETHTYRLSVERNGKHYSAESTMLPSVEITGMEFNWIKMPYDDVATLQVSFTDNPHTAGDCYWVRVYRNGKAYSWSAITDILSSNGIIDEVIMTSRKDIEEEDDNTVLVDGDIVTATVTPISRAMHDYLEALSQSGSNGPRMFQGDFCLGYFLASPVATATITFHPADIPYFN